MRERETVSNVRETGERGSERAGGEGKCYKKYAIENDTVRKERKKREEREGNRDTPSIEASGLKEREREREREREAILISISIHKCLLTTHFLPLSIFMERRELERETVMIVK